MWAKISGSVGQLTFKRVGGMTVVSEKITEVKNPRTEAQMRQRCKWTNIAAMFKGIRPLLNSGFESKAPGVSDYNMFMKINLQKTPVYLTKAQVAGGACVAAPYQITQGSLPAIVITGSGKSAVTDIFLAGEQISDSTTVAAFSKLVVDNNPDYKYGDQISYFLVKQMVNEATGIPYCQFSGWKVVLDAANNEKLFNVVPKNGFSTQDGCLGHSGNDGDCAYGWVHSRKSGGKPLVSSQSLVDCNSKLSDYQGDVVFAAASLSYGEVTSVFLSPDGNVSAPVDGGNNNAGGGSQGGGDSL